MGVHVHAPNIGVIGQTGSGKTTLMASIILENLNTDLTFIVRANGPVSGQFETMLPGWSYHTTHSPDFDFQRGELDNVLLWTGPPGQENFLEFLKSTFRCAAHGRICLVLDEANQIIPQRGINLNPYIDHIVQMGRHDANIDGVHYPSQGIMGMFGFRRFSTVSKTMTTQLRILFIKKQTSSKDLKSLEDYINIESRYQLDSIKTLQPGEFLRFDDGVLTQYDDALLIEPKNPSINPAEPPKTHIVESENDE